MRATLLIAALLASAACGKSDAKGGGGKRGPQAFPVEAATVASRKVEYVITAVGTVEAFERVQVTARVGGVVEKVSFREGTPSKAGQLLVEIEPSRYRLAAESAKAALGKSSAALDEARAGRERREQAVAKSPGLIPGEEIEMWRAREHSATADLAEKKVAVQKAQLDLRDALVRAPIDGLIETRTVETGQYVQPGTVLATIIRREPLMVRFHVTDADAVDLAIGMEARLGTAEAPQVARITFIAGAADEQSRMVPVLAELPREASADLRPGAFTQVSVPIGEQREAPVIPLTAVRPSERGFLAFVVVDGKAVERVLSLGLRTADGHVEVKSGLASGELLVVRGAEALRDGAAVRIVDPAAPVGAPPPSKPAEKPAGKPAP